MGDHKLIKVSGASGSRFWVQRLKNVAVKRF